MKEVSDVVLERIRQQAESIVQAARDQAGLELEEARRQREAAIEAEHGRRLAEADREAAQLIAQGIMASRNTVAAAKAGVIDEIFTRARAMLAAAPASEESLRALLVESIEAMGPGRKVIVIVAEEASPEVRRALAEDEQLASVVAEVRTRPIGGGVRIESEDGAHVVDNSYAARLETLLPRIVVRFGKELF